MNNHSPTCQVCGCPDLERVLDLGCQPLCNDFVPIDQATRPQTFYPLCLCYCPRCSLVQLDYLLPTQHAFGGQYSYLTGSSNSLVEYYASLTSKLAAKLELRPGDGVVDIGSNDGTFLREFQSLGMRVLGIEGAAQPAKVAVENQVPTLGRFFGKGISSAVKKNFPPDCAIRLITAMNVLAHTDNINEFLPEVEVLMEPDTIFVSQSHWLAALVRQFEFDTIYHEHLRYYTLESLMHLYKRHGLSIFDVEITDFYGGSILVYATKDSEHRSNHRPSALSAVLREEQEMSITQSLRDMKQVLLSNKARLLTLLVDIKSSGGRVVGIGAPMKASTLLNYYGVDSDLVEYIVEVNPLKVGTVVPGVGIPVVHEDIVFHDQPEYALLLSWNMAKSIMPKYREAGFRGKFILPVPQVEVIE